MRIAPSKSCFGCAGGRESYLRYLEFEGRYKNDLELRCFEYGTRSSGPRDLACREVLGGRVVRSGD